MNKLLYLQQDAAVGSTVTLHFSHGTSVCGRITELNDERVKLDFGDGRTATYFADVLAGFDFSSVHAKQANVSVSSVVADLVDTIDVSASWQRQPSRPTAATSVAHEAVESNATVAVDAGARITEVRVRTFFDERIANASLAAPEPDFAMPAQLDELAYDIRRDFQRDWNVVQNKYEYALKVKELSRVTNLLSQDLVPLAQAHPTLPEVHHLLGCLSLKVDRTSEAVQAFTRAATLSNSPAHWRGLAFAAKESTATQCFALRNFFKQTAPSETMREWFCYLGSALKHADFRGVAECVTHWHAGDNGTTRILSESALYVLLVLGETKAAADSAAAIASGDYRLTPAALQLLLKGGPVTPDLLSVESTLSNRAALQEPKPAASSGTDKGMITSFGHLRFGFIRGDAGETLFFKLEDVDDESLQQHLRDGNWRDHPDVEFDGEPSPGHKYRRATRVAPVQNVKSLLERAEIFVRIGQYTEACRHLKRVLSNEPSNSRARELEEQARQRIRERGVGLPAGNGPYARAKRAQADEDLERYEALLSDAIKANDKRSSAIKDLASLWQQVGRAQDAIALLEQERVVDRSPTHSGAYDNQLSTLYQHAGHHEKAIEILRSLLGGRNALEQRPILKRIALSLFKLRRYDECERTLKEVLKLYPNDSVARRWLQGLEEAQTLGSYVEAEKLFSGGELTEEGIELSPLAREAIKTCPYEGVKPEKVSNGTAGLHEIKHLEELARHLGMSRPRDRAAYYLSAAALSERVQSDERAKVYDYIRRYFTSMADASLSDLKPVDVVRAYYMESLALVFRPELYEAWYGLLRYLATLAQTLIEDIVRKLPASKHPTSKQYTEALCATFELLEESASPSWMHTLLALGASGAFARDVIATVIRQNAAAQRVICVGLSLDPCDPAKLAELWRERCTEYARHTQMRMSACQSWTNYQANASAMENLGRQLDGAAPDASGKVDSERIRALREIVRSAQEFCRATEFEEAEINYFLVRTRADKLLSEIHDKPTQYSHGGLAPVAQHVASLIEEQYAQVELSSGAELTLKLLVQEYCQDKSGQVRLQIEVSNKSGCSPANRVRVVLGPAESEYFELVSHEQNDITVVRGGSVFVTQVAIRPTPGALQAGAFPVVVRAHYHRRIEDDIVTPEQAWTVRLYSESDFTLIPDNPYLPCAEGGPLEDETMFVGREALLEQLESALITSGHRKSLVMFGQKRAGKSSLLYHLEQRLRRRDGILPVRFSIQELSPDISEQAVCYEILMKLARALQKREQAGGKALGFQCPSYEELGAHPTLKFHAAMSDLADRIESSGESLQFIVLIDEFTDIFKQIQRGKIDRDFMKAWKAIVEKRYFSSVLVGQEIMQRFKQAFPNEFGVTEDTRVTYLDEASACELVTIHIGEDRFAGRAIERILELTASSPYYMMMYCARLVDYINTTRSKIVTEADVMRIRDGMVSGARRLGADKFDNLLCEGDAVDDVNSGLTRAVCVAIAKHTDRGWCPRGALNALDEGGVDAVLEELADRDVIERKDTAYRLRVDLFREWLVTQG